MRRKHVYVMKREEGGMIVALREEDVAEPLFKDHTTEGRHEEENRSGGHKEGKQEMRTRGRRLQHRASGISISIGVEH